MIIPQSQFKKRQVSKLVKGTVVPRPIAWTSTISKKGVQNLAPFSFFTVASLDPVLFCISISPGGDAGKSGNKDTLANINAMGEFVINIVSETQANQMHESSKAYHKTTNEFEKAGLEAQESRMIRPPCIANAPVNMECRLDRLIPAGRNHLVIGKLICYHIRDDVYMKGNKVNYQTLEPIGRMAGDYAFIRNFFTLPNLNLPDQ